MNLKLYIVHNTKKVIKSIHKKSTFSLALLIGVNKVYTQRVIFPKMELNGAMQEARSCMDINGSGLGMGSAPHLPMTGAIQHITLVGKGMSWVGFQNMAMVSKNFIPMTLSLSLSPSPGP